MSNPNQDYADLHQQLQSINAQRARNLMSLQHQQALENEIIENTRDAAELAAMTQNGDDAGDNLEQYKEWISRRFDEQNKSIERAIRFHEDSDNKLERSTKLLLQNLKYAAKDIAATFDPEHLAETTGDQSRALLTMLGTSVLATNFEKIEGFMHKVYDFFGSGNFKKTIEHVAGTEESGGGILKSLGKIIKAPFEYFVEWIKGELLVRAKSMDAVNIPSFKSNVKNFGKLQPIGNMITSLSNFLGDFVSSLSDKLKILIDPRSSITYRSNKRISESAESTREIKRNIDAKTKDWNERGLLYTKDGNRNYLKSIPSVFQTPLGGLDGTHGSTLAASREIYRILQEALTGNRADTASLVDTFNKLWIIAKRNKYVLVEECFLDSLYNGDEFKKNPVVVHVLRRKFRLDVALVDALLPFDLRDKKTIYLTDSEWKELNKDCKKDFEEICQVTVYKLTLKDLNAIASGQLGLKNFDPSNNENFIGIASTWLESNKGGEGSEEEARLINLYSNEGMVDQSSLIFEEERENYENQKQEIIDKIKDLSKPLGIYVPREGSGESSHTVEVVGFSLVPSNPGGEYPLGRAGTTKLNPKTGKRGNLAYRNNNPGNIVWTGNNNLFPGEIPVESLAGRGSNSTIKNGFKTFKTLQDGFEGIYYNLDHSKSYFKGGNNTLEGIISKWCPNDPTYINNVSSALGISKNAPISMEDRDTMINLAKAIYKQEDNLGFSVLDPGIVDSAYDHYMSTYYAKGDPGNDGTLYPWPSVMEQPQAKIPFKIKQETPITTTTNQTYLPSVKYKKSKTEELDRLSIDTEIESEKAIIEAIKVCIIDGVGNKIDKTNSLLR